MFKFEKEKVEKSVRQHRSFTPVAVQNCLCLKEGAGKKTRS